MRSLCFSDIDARRNNIITAHTDTCDWLFRTSNFQQWYNQDDLLKYNGVLWIKGKPGAGKSTLMKHAWSLFNHAVSDCTLVAYFFNARGSPLEKSPLGMLRSVLSQILDQDRPVCERFIETVFIPKQKKHGNNYEWHYGELKDFLLRELEEYQSRPIILFTDALDECNDAEVQEVVSFLEALSKNAVSSGMSCHICLSSRHYPTITMEKKLELIVDYEEGHNEDIAKYVHDKLRVREEHIEKELIRKAEHVFMWVVLVVQMLNQAFDRGKVRAMENKLDELPSDLDMVFSTLLNEDNSDRQETILMLQWVLFARRPLKPEELYFAVLSGTATEELGAWDQSRESEETIRRYITSTSKGLVEIRRGDTTTVQFIHESVNDFLVRHNRLRTLDPSLELHPVGSSHESLANCCLSYIMMGELEPIEVSNENRLNTTKDMDKKYPFLEYASTSLLDHVEKSQKEPIVHRVLLRRLENSPNEFQRFRAFHDVFFPFHARDRYGIDAELLYVVSFHGHYELVQQLLECKIDVNANGGFYGSALQAATTSGDEAVVQLLLEHGAKINTCGGKYGSALHAAAYLGNEAIVRLLLERGADYNTQSENYGSVLQVAAYTGNASVVSLLLERGANVNAQSGHYGSALQAAARGLRSEDEAVVRLLLQHGADVNAKGGFCGSALQAAATYGDEAISRVLLEYGAEVDAPGGKYGSPLQAAAYMGNEAVVRLLLEHGADVSIQGGHFGSSLQAATAIRGNDVVVQLLLEYGADVNAQGGFYGSAMKAAALKGNLSVVRLLRKYGARKVIENST
jgi:ankyrin repeat protein